MKKRITITAGLLTYEVQHPVKARHECSQLRAPKTLPSCTAQVFMNNKYSYQKLELMLAANIRPGDIVGVLTYSDDKIPGTRKDAANDYRYFCSKLRRCYGEDGLELPRLLYCIEQSHDDSIHDGKRWHIHFAMRSTGKDYDKIRACWTKGIVLLAKFNLNPKVWIDELGLHERVECSDKRGYEPLARYMCKEPREKLGLRTWSYSRNCVKPETDVQYIEDDRRLQLPEHCDLINSANETANDYEMIKFLRPVLKEDRAPKPVR